MLQYFIFSRAKEKAANIVEHIGYPSELMEVNKLEELYDGLHINSTHYLGNALSMTVFGTNYAFSKLREKKIKNNPTIMQPPDRQKSSF